MTEMMKTLWASVQGDPVFMRRVNGWLTLFWILMIPSRSRPGGSTAWPTWHPSRCGRSYRVTGPRGRLPGSK
jgi:hypothetical protein